jgi:hypothetical protein
VAATFGAAVALLVGASMPPARIVLDGGDEGVVSGALHIHTHRSDGRGSPSDVALAASRAGLRFVILTDHGDGTRVPDPPMYRSGVLCIDAVEVSTTGGHLLAIGMPMAPYPLGGSARAVVEDVHRLGGLAIAAHPDSPREDLRWRDWTLPVDGVEILNLDTSWRRAVYRPGWRSLRLFAQSLVAYPLRSEEAIASLLSVSPESVEGYLAAGRDKRVTLLGGTDAHARVGWRSEPGEADYSLPFPGYETVFRTLAVRLRPAQPFSGHPEADAQAVVDAIRAGRLHTVVTGLAGPSAFEFTAANARGIAGEGGSLAPDGPVALRVRSNAPDGFVTAFFDGAALVAERSGTDVSVTVPGPAGIYRVEIRAPGTDAPVWIVSNPIGVRPPSTAGPAAKPARVEGTAIFDGGDASAWRVEVADTSTARLTRAPAGEGAALVFSYALGDGVPAGQFAALVVETRDGVAPYDRVTFRARGDRPMRVSVQARVAVSASVDEAWARSVYVDPEARDISVFFDEMASLGATRTPSPPADRIHSLVFAVDLTNTRPGTAGEIRILGADLER